MNLFTPGLFEMASATHVGRVRGDTANQDSVKVLTSKLFRSQPPLLIVADGMGGHAGGSVASRCVVVAFEEAYRREKILPSPCEVLEQAVRQAHAAVCARARSEPKLSTMGSTVVAAMLMEDGLTLINVGDSRLYRFRGREIQQLSYDQSYVADLVRKGEITADEARTHPKKNILSMSISAHRKEVIPYCAQVDLEYEDVVLLCSDGLWGVVPETQIRAVACQLSPREAVRKLIQLANTLGGPDNVSVIIARRHGYSIEKDPEE